MHALHLVDIAGREGANLAQGVDSRNILAVHEDAVFHATVAALEEFPAPHAAADLFHVGHAVLQVAVDQVLEDAAQADVVDPDGRVAVRGDRDLGLEVFLQGVLQHLQAVLQQPGFLQDRGPRDRPETTGVGLDHVAVRGAEPVRVDGRLEATLVVQDEGDGPLGDVGVDLVSVGDLLGLAPSRIPQESQVLAERDQSGAEVPLAVLRVGLRVVPEEEDEVIVADEGRRAAPEDESRLETERGSQYAQKSRRGCHCEQRAIYKWVKVVFLDCSIELDRVGKWKLFSAG